MATNKKIELTCLRGYFGIAGANKKLYTTPKNCVGIVYYIFNSLMCSVVCGA